MKNTMKFLAFLFVISVVSCSPVRVLDTEKAQDADLRAYKTFDFYKLEASGDTVSEKFRQYTDVLKQAITNQMQERGYTMATSDPDLLVNIGILVKEETQTRETTIREAPRYIGQRRYSWKSEEVEVGRYKSGTVTLHLVDADQNKMVWKGAVEGVISNRPKNIENDIKVAMDKLFAKLP
jgi:hypothetical protein